MFYFTNPLRKDDASQQYQIQNLINVELAAKIENLDILFLLLYLYLSDKTIAGTFNFTITGDLQDIYSQTLGKIENVHSL